MKKTIKKAIGLFCVICLFMGSRVFINATPPAKENQTKTEKDSKGEKKPLPPVEYQALAKFPMKKGGYGITIITAKKISQIEFKSLWSFFKTHGVIWKDKTVHKYASGNGLRVIVVRMPGITREYFMTAPDY